MKRKEIRNVKDVLDYIEEKRKEKGLTKGGMLKQAKLSPSIIAYWNSSDCKAGPQLQSIMCLLNALQLEFVINSKKRIRSNEEAIEYIFDRINKKEIRKTQRKINVSNTFLYMVKNQKGIMFANFLEILEYCNDTITIEEIM